ncbi:carbohydrate ABC transporter permease [Cryptosporangium phraense]|uniref:Carbohydrate ABC transporter permease n=1 Tax=Cryptosporangium phraense TaxID=2593070 RepID=A0A545AE81_9ACTN|nr:carbohydrate ABC transporter permease [Cryptosporangium phraense]TQS39632.1 carbohydrate ABC transporter permease [Cryptosporangium phraense]
MKRKIGVFLVVVWSLLPIYWALKISLQTEGDARAASPQYIPLHPTFDNYKNLLSGSGDTATGIRSSLLNIVIECGAATIVTVVLAALAAYAFARMTFRGHTLLFYGVLVTMAFPAYTTLIPLYRLMSDLYLVNTYTGVVLVYVSGFLPLATWVLHNYFSGMPASIEEAGLIDGANRLQVFWHIMLPLARPGIISTALITFLFAWAQFLFPLVLTTDTSTQPLTVVIASLQGRHVVPVTLLSAAGMIAIAVPAVVALVFNRYIVNGLLAGSAK